MPAVTSKPPTPQGIRHPDGCAFCPAELLGLERDANGDPLCQTCPHLTVPGKLAKSAARKDER